MTALHRSRSVTIFVLAGFLGSLTAPPIAGAQRRGHRTPATAAARDDADDGDSDAEQDEDPQERAATGGVNVRSGFELELHGTASVIAGRPLNLRGVAYAVIGLATLRPLPRSRVAVFEIRDGLRQEEQPLGTATTDALGRFEVTVPPSARISVVVGSGRHTRNFDFSVQIRSPHRLELLTDRALYEPGETVHAWARVTDIASGAPVADRPVELRIVRAGAHAVNLAVSRAGTSRGGIVTLDLPIPANAPEGPLNVSARIDDRFTAEAAQPIRVGRRTVERLMAEMRLAQRVVAPGSRVTGTVSVRTPSGAPVRSARVEIRFDPREQPIVAETNAQGIAAITFSAPSYLSESMSEQMIDVRVVHRAFGAVRTAARYTLARVPYVIEAVAGAGGVVPEVNSPVYLTIADPRGDPPPAGTGVTVAGPGVDHGSFHGSTDRHGVVMVPFRLPAGAAARHEAGTCAGVVAASFDVTVETGVPVTARLCARAVPRAQVIPRAAMSAIAPGGRLEIAIERRPAVRTRPVVVDLLHREEQSGTLSVLSSVIVAPGANRITMTVPTPYLGVVIVRARPVGDSGVAEGVGAQDAVLVRPEHAFALALSPERPQYHVRENARVIARTPAGLTDGRIAIVARDLAAHAGESPFALAWLRGQLAASIASPATLDADRLIRAALAAFLAEDPIAVRAPPLVPPLGASDDDSDDQQTYSADEASARGDLRDPFALRDELLRRGVAPAMTAIESAIGSEEGERRGIVTRTGRRGFDPRIVHTLTANGDLESDSAQTLGGGAMTIAMLQAADPAFTFDRVARRVARKQLVHLLASLSGFIEPGEGERSAVADEPADRWLSRMVQRSVITAAALRDPWGGNFALRRVAPGHEHVAFAVRASGWELSSPGPDHVAGNADDVRDPFERVVPQGSVYAVVSGEDTLMRQLAALDPGGDVLTQIAAAYHRVASGADEESQGDAAGAETSESIDALAGLGASGVGAGGGGTGQGIGYASARPAQAAGRMRSRGAASGGESDDEPSEELTREIANERVAREPAAPRPEAPAPPPPARSESGPRVAQLAALVRERFPATLRIVAEMALDASGSTAIEVPMADALTTYRFDAIAWTGGGWTTSASVDVHVDQDAVIDAPVPPFVVIGDSIRLPLRLSNRSDHVIRARVSVATESGLQVDTAGGGAEISVEPGDAGEVPVTITARRAGTGTLVVTAVDAASGQPLDAARRPMQVLADARPVRMAAEALIDGRGTLVLDVPADATYRADGGVRITLGEAIFGDARSWGEVARDPTWPLWTLAMGNIAVPAALLQRMRRERNTWAREDAADPVALARLIGGIWPVAEITDEDLAHGLNALTRALERSESLTFAQYGTQRVDVLLGLAPAFAGIERRAALATPLRAVLSSLRRRVETDTSSAPETAAPYARAAVALALTERTPSARVTEFMRRAARTLVRVGDEVFVEAGGGEASARITPSAIYALAALATGDRTNAFAIARTLGKNARRVSSWPEEARAMATAMMERLTPAGPGVARTSLRVSIDGRGSDVPMTNGVGTLVSRELSTPGHHAIEIALPPGTILIAEAEARYGRPWTAVPAVRGALAVTLDGAVGGRDTRAGLILRVQNRGPRVLSAPVVEIDLPAGAEIDEDTRQEIRRRTAQLPTLSGRTLVLSLRSLAPGGFVRVPLALRWSVGGRVRGLGIGAYGAAEPGAGTTVMPSREVTIPDGGPEPNRPVETPRRTNVTSIPGSTASQSNSLSGTVAR